MPHSLEHGIRRHAQGGLAWWWARIVGAMGLVLAAGGLWLASPNRVFEGLEGGPCDDKPPAYKVHRAKRLTIAALKRGELRVTVREPAAIEFYVIGPSRLAREAHERAATCLTRTDGLA